MMFDSFLGNERLKALFSRCLFDGTLSHAYLFVGAHGMGKRTFVSEAVKAICCLSEKDRPCGICPACKKCELSAHPDVHTLRLDPDEKSIKVDQVRAYISTIDLKPNECDYKVYVVEDAHTMGREAQNALLKTLEEPVGNAVFFLLADDESNILSTVRSRCTVFYMEPIAEDELCSHLMKKTGASKEDAMLAAKLSLGSVGAAFEILQGKGLAAVRTQAKNVLDAIRAGDRTEVCALLSSKAFGTREKLISVYGLLQLAMRDIATREYGRARPDFFISEQELSECARKFTKARAISFFDLLEAEKEELLRNGNTGLSVLRVASFM